MVTIDILGLILVIIGLLLTTNNVLTNRIASNEAIGWALAALGMFLLFVSDMISGDIIFAVITLLFTIVNAYFSVNNFKKDKR